MCDLGSTRAARVSPTHRLSSQVRELQADVGRGLFDDALDELTSGAPKLSQSIPDCQPCAGLNCQRACYLLSACV